MNKQIKEKNGSPLKLNNLILGGKKRKMSLFYIILFDEELMRAREITVTFT